MLVRALAGRSLNAHTRTLKRGRGAGCGCGAQACQPQHAVHPDRLPRFSRERNTGLTHVCLLRTPCFTTTKGGPRRHVPELVL